jgi:hypothetical protein
VPESTLEQPRKNGVDDWDPGMDVVDLSCTIYWENEKARRQEANIKKKQWIKLLARRAAEKQSGENRHYQRRS